MKKFKICLEYFNETEFPFTLSILSCVFFLPFFSLMIYLFLKFLVNLIFWEENFNLVPIIFFISSFFPIFLLIKFDGFKKQVLKESFFLLSESFFLCFVTIIIPLSVILDSDEIESFYKYSLILIWFLFNFCYFRFFKIKCRTAKLVTIFVFFSSAVLGLFYYFTIPFSFPTQKIEDGWQFKINEDRGYFEFSNQNLNKAGSAFIHAAGRENLSNNFFKTFPNAKIGFYFFNYKISSNTLQVNLWPGWQIENWNISVKKSDDIGIELRRIFLFREVRLQDRKKLKNR